MSSNVMSRPGHPVAEFPARVHRVLDSLLGVPVWSMSAGELRETLVELARAQSRVEELRLRCLAAADRVDVAAQTGATSTAAWVAVATGQPVATAHGDVKLATALDGERGATREALATGRIDPAQARVIVESVAAIPADALAEDPTAAGRAEAMLLDLAADHDAKRLRVLGRHIVEVIDPDTAEERLGRRLEREEAAAARRTSLQVHDNGDGTHTGRFTISTLHAAALTKALDAFTHPARRDGLSAETRRPVRLSRPELLGQAFCDLLERLPTDRLPQHGGVTPTLVVTLDYDTLLTGLGTAHLDTGQPISAGLARRLACEAGIIPALVRRMVDGSSVVLDMGRKRRLHTEHMRIALALHQGGCTAEGCDRPPGWAQAHHDIAWAEGGATSVANGRLLCGHHHRRAHSPDYQTHHLPNGKVQFHRRT